MPDNAVRIQAAVARATIRAMGYTAANSTKVHYGEPPVYASADFESLIVDEGIDWNSVVDATRE